ncbi:ParB/RepB/Spo0J family partition protein [Blastococcus sp. CCUG 61487]|uniref:ParB/RepB/Spo0J family partition protein n=1 Tax=Blastococcus sp. CCUG 61487 TaxID=1840703 RepID=UPI0010C12139|nr:ParB/RepB/Spo0J family partition protein [Blastococcus sp. CCUG 61487]TKJ24343.1 hypothetical protein A6V29_04920 [Blastococcus sp. CCUG 61487]
MSALPASQWRDAVRLDAALLDPHDLAPHPRNVRQDLGDLSGLTASIAEQGVIEPLTVVQLEHGGYQLVAGHRRAAAAIAAGLDQVPCVIRRDLSVDAEADHVQAEHVGAMLAENLQRAELTAVEEARGVQTMLDLGADVDVVAARTGLERTRVLKATGVARLAPDAASAVEHAGLTLDQAAVVARFEGDTTVVEQLVAAAGLGPGRFAHAVTRAEQQRAEAEAIAARRAELEAMGRRVVDSDEDGERLDDLLHAGASIDPEQHRACPGSVVRVSAYSVADGVRTHDVELCADPAGNGHTARWNRDPAGSPGTSMSDEELERQRDERRAVVENNRTMAAANTTRRTWVREYLARPKAPKEVLRFAVEALATDRPLLAEWLGGQGGQDVDDAAAELGLSRSTWRATAKPGTLTSGQHVVDARLPLQLLAHVAAAHEGRITRDAWRWRDDRRHAAARWLRFLAGQGYELSDVEQQLVDGADQ